MIFIKFILNILNSVVFLVMSNSSVFYLVLYLVFVCGIRNCVKSVGYVSHYVKVQWTWLIRLKSPT